MSLSLTSSSKYLYTWLQLWSTFVYYISDRLEWFNLEYTADGD